MFRACPKFHDHQSMNNKVMMGPKTEDPNKTMSSRVKVNFYAFLTLNPISMGVCFPPQVLFFACIFLFLSQVSPNLVTFPKI